MKSRLGISVATAFKPDLLLIDEVLGVGDASFREKSKNRVQKLIRESGAVVIVSHSMGLLSEICNRIVHIEHGDIISIGDPDEVIRKYLEMTTD
jgi:ABC-type polysaccharide/polyol phosphate transport system ATPase subunit